jgi:hypothetical protein
MTTKKSALLLALAFSLTLLFNSCGKTITATGPVITKSFALSNFDKVAVQNDAHVTYIADSVFSVIVNAQQDMLDRMNVVVNGRELKISYKWGITIVKHEPINITVHAPAFKGAEVTGSGSINVPSPFKPASLDINVTGSGNVFLNEIITSTTNIDVNGSGDVEIGNLETASCSLDVSGSGDILLAGGKISTMDARVSGSGFIEAQNLPCSTATANTTGSGKITIFVLAKLIARISGSGNIFVKGDPTIDQSISGSGKIIKI